MGEIRIYPDPILRKKAIPIKNIDGKVKEIADRMAEVMYANKGIGLAAPQIGIPNQIFVVDIGEGRRVFINPEIIEGDGESLMEEGCSESGVIWFRSQGLSTRDRSSARYFDHPSYLPIKEGVTS